MTAEEVVNRIKSALGDQLSDFQQRSDKRLCFQVASQHIDEVAQLFNEIDARLQTASAVDAPQEIEILYHWAIDALGMVITVKTSVDRDRPEIDSITPTCPAAEWIEREMWELLGISFRNHPDLRHLLLQDDWPEGKFPLRRDYRKA